MNPYGIATSPETIRIERTLPGPIERVWAYLVEPDKRALWFAGGPMDLRAGGQAQLVFRNSELTTNDGPAPAHYQREAGVVTMESTITACDPPHLLSFTFGPAADSSEATFELAERGDEVELVITHRRLVKYEMKLSVATGWHTHLEMLIARLEEREPAGFWNTFTTLEQDYKARLPR